MTINVNVAMCVRSLETNRCTTHGSRWHEGLCATAEVLWAVRDERARQYARYGTNEDQADGTGENWLGAVGVELEAWEIEAEFRAEYEFTESQGQPVTWLQLVREEVAEAFCEKDPGRLEAELVQVAALCVSWIEKLRERRS
jgi:hypothetical protein